MKRDPLWDQWTMWRYNTTDPAITPSERGRINRALKELRIVHATPELMMEKIKWWQANWSVPVTISGLSANWSNLGVTIPKRPRDLDDIDLVKLCRSRGIDTIGKSKQELLRRLAI